MERISDDQTVITHPKTGGSQVVARTSMQVWRRLGWAEVDPDAPVEAVDKPAVPAEAPPAEKAPKEKPARPDKSTRSE